MADWIVKVGPDAISHTFFCKKIFFAGSSPRPLWVLASPSVICDFQCFLLSFSAFRKTDPKQAALEGFVLQGVRLRT